MRIIKYTLSHIGIARRSGRYKWGSGDDPEQRDTSFLGQVAALRKSGVSQVDIAKGFGMKTTELRRKISLSKNEEMQYNMALANRLLEKGMSKTAIAARMGRNESYVRSLLKPKLDARAKITDTIAGTLRDAVEAKNYVDIGIGVERYMGISRTRLRVAVSKLEEEGYRVHKTKVKQLGTGQYTNLIVLTKADTTFGDVMKNKDKIKLPNDYSEDGGDTFTSLKPIKSIDSSRVLIRYGDEGGSEKDGVIELRRGVDDISLGNSKYAQVRIGVDDKSYMKGMAMYNDDIPKGYDIVYNTNKPKGTAPEKVFKPMVDDPDNPFGSTVRQKEYLKNGKKELSLLNIVNEEGEWGEWSRSISSQVLSKQSTTLAKTQLGISFDMKKQEFDDIKSLTNPVVKQKLMETYADSLDSASVHLKAAALPRQQSQVILPFPGIKENEVYAPNYNNGERVVLIRYPHGGIFEIPELVVNNKHKPAVQAIGNAKDGIGINPKVAEILSGADFDGDSVLVIPNDKRLIKNAKPLEQLKNFDPKIDYPGYPGMKVMTAKSKGIQMGSISNLITDMTIKGASHEELARAVKHSMVVIDAEKHKLNYKLSFINNGIAQLKKDYQGSAKSGSTTLISRASAETRVGDRKITIDPKTGEKIYEYTGKTYKNMEGKDVLKTTKSSKMYETKDAFELSSGTPMETIYANHANKLKALSNEARKISINTKFNDVNLSAKKTYAKEVADLDAKLNIALKAAPLERRAQLIATKIYNTRLERYTSKGDVEDSTKKKLKGQSLAAARSRINPEGKHLVDITDKEWEAIQAGAISNSKLKTILNNTDLDKVKQLAMPRTKESLQGPKLQKAKILLKAGYTQSEVANSLGVNISMLTNLL